MSATNMRAALALARKGLAVFPCVPRSKVPATENGFHDATKDTSVVEAWWQVNPAYNVAIATGPASGFFAIDVDGLDAEIELRKLEAAHSVLPPSIEVITASGRHIYFRMPPEIDLRCSAGQLAPGLDCRAAGGYVVAPPSIHPSGRRYAWSVDCASAIAAAPDWLVAKLGSRSNGNGTRPVPPAEWRALAANGVAEGARDTSVTRLAGYLLRRHVDPFLALELLQSWNAQRCTPPLPAADIDRIVESIAGRELRRRAADDG